MAIIQRRLRFWKKLFPNFRDTRQHHTSMKAAMKGTFRAHNPTCREMSFSYFRGVSCLEHQWTVENRNTLDVVVLVLKPLIGFSFILIQVISIYFWICNTIVCRMFTECLCTTPESAANILGTWWVWYYSWLRHKDRRSFEHGRGLVYRRISLAVTIFNTEIVSVWSSSSRHQSHANCWSSTKLRSSFFSVSGPDFYSLIDLSNPSFLLTFSNQLIHSAVLVPVTQTFSFLSFTSLLFICARHI